MRRLCLMVFVALIGSGQLIALSAWADEGAEKAAAQKATEAWLALVDSGKYAESWDQAAELFKKQVTKEQWAKAADAARSPLGRLDSRKLSSAEYSKTLPGAPDGEYVVIQFQSAFANKKSAVETLAPMKDKDGRWRVSGYHIK
jgi:Protein of unknown function (DUF4019)